MRFCSQQRSSIQLTKRDAQSNFPSLKLIRHAASLKIMEKLLPYYERELTFVRNDAREFAERFPKIAGRLQVAGDVCEDPHVERLIESFALLSARVHKKLDDDFPEFTQAL